MRRQIHEDTDLSESQRSLGRMIYLLLFSGRLRLFLTYRPNVYRT